MKRTLMTALTLIATVGAANANDLKATECAIFSSASMALADHGQTVQGLLSDCPLALQIASADIRPMAQPRRYRTPLAAQLHNTLVQRGIPLNLANEIAMSPAFGQWYEMHKALR